MTYYKNFTLLIAVLLFTACGSKVKTFQPTDKDLNQYKTFAHLPNTNVEVEGKRYTDETVTRTIIETVNSNMRQVGYTLDRDNPDLLVLLSVYTQEGLRRTQEPVYSYYPYAAPYRVNPYYDPYYFYGWQSYGGIIGYTTDTYPYEEGTLIIDLIDRETKETVWKGVLSEDIYGEPDVMAIREMVNEIFAEFPLNK